MGPVAGFIAALLVTVGFLVGAALTGRFRRIRAHVLMVVGSLASLSVAIYYALSVGEVYDLEAAGVITPIHLGLARLTTAPPVPASKVAAQWYDPATVLDANCPDFDTST